MSRCPRRRKVKLTEEPLTIAAEDSGSHTPFVSLYSGKRLVQSFDRLIDVVF